MKIKEILELSFTVKMNEIAKDHLSIGEKRLRSILKEIGCTHQVGKRGWIYIGDDQQILEKSIYDFAQPTATKKRTDERKNIPTNEQKSNTSKEQSNQQTKEQTKEPTKETTHIMRKRASFDIELELLKELKIFAIREEKNVYEIVEQAIKNYIRGS